MKKFIKFCAVTGLVLLLAGVGITSVSVALGGDFSTSFPNRIWHAVRYHMGYDDWDDWDDSDDSDQGSGWTQLQEDELPKAGGQTQAGGTGSAAAVGTGNAAADETAGADHRTVQTFNTTKKLDIDLDQGFLKIREVQDISQIKINIHDSDNAVKCYMDHDTLKIKRQTHRRWHEDPKVEILVPEGYVFDKVSMDMGAAGCTIDQLHTAKLDIDAGVGTVVFTGTVTGDVELEAGVGEITLNLSGRQENYNYTIECGVGSIQIGDDVYSMLSHDTHVNNNARNNMEVECGVGSIHVNFDESQ